ncbi:hypothetical protein P1J78_10510 [Psychromarinibacter sp. C21-152]|uniref:Uncharacterized protein n=1 Tax=Psychromarinibacter sediminicola TaxID=3033385 RepID=A0AAE3T890_9RHOB|nr:hypothetical protein [Psychromarinibacter sediminicola]MDF0601160.1 hypothetical protein [Psychromarinibacter sediminicola]
MPKTPLDHDHTRSSGRVTAYTRLERIKAGEGAHPNIKLLDRRKRKGPTDASRVKQFLRIERGYLA